MSSIPLSGNTDNIFMVLVELFTIASHLLYYLLNSRYK